MPKWPVDKYILDVGDPDGHYDLSEIGKWAAGDIAERHNADIDALTAERDELQRRLDAVVAKISEAVVSDDDCVCSMLCHSAITAIAEGRDNG